MDEHYFEIDYEIEADFDMEGDFSLQCATLLFDLLNINGNVIIKNQYAQKAEKRKTISKYVGNEQNYFYEWPKHPEGNYCIWIKESFSTNQEIIDILKLQGTYLSYIAPTDSFDWEDFLKNWKKDERYLLLSRQASFICNIIDMDRTLNINFNTAIFSTEKIVSIISKWQEAITLITKPSKVSKSETKIRSKHGNKYQVQLCFCNI